MIALALAIVLGSAAPAQPPLTLDTPPIGEGPHTRLPPIVVGQTEPSRDRRPLYVGFGIVVVAAGLWWFHDRRQRRDIR